VCSKCFFGRDNELQIHHGNYLLTDNKHRKLSVIKQSDGCKLMPKMHQYVWRPDPLVELMRAPDPLAPTGGLLLRGGMEGRGLLLRGTVGKTELTERERRKPPLKSRLVGGRL